jgi:hypothetical protein
VRILRLLMVVLCVAALALAASGCGGGGKSVSGTKPSAWAATVCGAVNDWTARLQAEGSRLSSGLDKTTDIEVVKTSLVAYLDSAARSAGTMVTRIDEAGAPAVKDGAAIQRDLVSGLKEAQASLTRALGRAKKLSTTDPQTFTIGVQALGADIQEELTAVSGKVNTVGDKYNDPTLSKATSEEPACSGLAGGG